MNLPTRRRFPMTLPPSVLRRRAGRWRACIERRVTAAAWRELRHRRLLLAVPGRREPPRTRNGAFMAALSLTRLPERRPMQNPSTIPPRDHQAQTTSVRSRTNKRDVDRLGHRDRGCPWPWLLGIGSSNAAEHRGQSASRYGGSSSCCWRAATSPASDDRTISNARAIDARDGPIENNSGVGHGSMSPRVVAFALRSWSYCARSKLPPTPFGSCRGPGAAADIEGRLPAFVQWRDRDVVNAC
jgi:hypothetical protein